MHRVMAKNKWDQMRNRYSGPWGPNPWINSASVGPPPHQVADEMLEPPGRDDKRQHKDATSVGEGEGGSAAAPAWKV